MKDEKISTNREQKNSEYWKSNVRSLRYLKAAQTHIKLSVFKRKYPASLQRQHIVGCSFHIRLLFIQECASVIPSQHYIHRTTLFVVKRLHLHWQHLLAHTAAPFPDPSSAAVKSMYFDTFGPRIRARYSFILRRW